VVRSWIAPTLLVAALAVSALAAWMAHTSIPKAAVAPMDGVILSVLPGGPAWDAGIRPGQSVVSLTAGEQPEEWRLRTRTDLGTTVAVKAWMIATLRATTNLTLLAVAASLLGSALLVGGPARAAGLAVLALVLARPAMLATGDMAGSSVVALAALAAPVVWLLAWSGRRWSARLAALLATVVGGAWLLLRFQASEDPELARAYDLSAGALTIATYLLAAVVVLSIAVLAVRTRSAGYDTRRLGDVIVIGVAAVSAPIAIASDVPVLMIALGVAVLLLLYPLSRRHLAAALDRLVLGDLRAQSSVEAIERERQRMSREIHDEPLQDIAAVIHRLASHPELAAETAMLQEVSGHLRGVTMQLHPPILTDLGLAASLDYLATETRRGSVATIAADIKADDGARPPAPVELAAFRIAQEALTNAVRHSAARQIIVRARIDAHELVVEVSDDGVGLDGVAVGQALARGHVGLRSMGERAELVGGNLRVADAGPGTRITFRWPA